MTLPPVLYHYFKVPLPYARTLALQESLHALQLEQRKTSGTHKDILLLLQHRPVYTGGRRQTEAELALERERLMNLGADFMRTQRGGQLTYHGPGQLTGYPLLDLGRTRPPLSIREYICRMQKMVELQLREVHGLEHVPSEHTGVFLDSRTKVGSIGVQVRHRLTTHGFAYNVTCEPVRWLDEIVACGLSDMRAGSVEGAAGKRVSVEDEIPGLVERFGRSYERDMVEMDVNREGRAGELIAALEEEARWMEPPPSAPKR
ncbi:hypothetical protein EWM64_g8273 [Hericium alpestre]|uniref:lipoyl(octanoyl) transferase n=1 Tax=Hericium alpestre TaxID=135208 RepID=A0A4Y9ZQK9_9AGAM|nr:hypothetical protein EWM64_g8273 [Hericium alpestre]